MLARAQIEKTRLVRLVSARVDAVRQQRVARRGLERADRAVLERFRDFVHVEHDFRSGVSFRSTRAKDHRVRASLDGAHEVLVFGSPGERCVVVGFLDGVFDLRVQRFAQRLDVLEVFLRVRVFRLEVREHLGVAPRVVPEPEQIVVSLDGGGHGVRPAVLAGNSPEKNLVRLLLRLRGFRTRTVGAFGAGRRFKNVVHVVVASRKDAEGSARVV